MTQQIWYVAFGSNTVPALLGRSIPVEDIEHQAVTIPHELYFAGRAWGAAPAFVEHVRDDDAATPARAYLLDVEHLPALMGGENRHFAGEWNVDVGVMTSGDVVTYPVPLADDEGVGKYNALLRLDDIDGTPAVTIPHELYFAGRAWGAAPAFVEHVRDDDAATPARAYLLDVEHLPALMGGENRHFADEWNVDVGVMTSGDVVDYPVPLADDEGVGKYNALLRLDDIDGTPAVTITTTHQLTRGGPSNEYLTVIREGLSSDHDIALLEQHLQAAIERSHPTTRSDSTTRSEL